MRPLRAQPLLFHPRLHRLPCRQCLIVRLPLNLTARHNSSKPTEPPENLPSSKRSTITARAAEYIDTLQLRALAATQRLNDITGYSSIEALKTQIHTQDAAARTARESVVNAKQAYSSAVDTRAETQRELTNLLNRKTSWTPDDLARFTYLYPSDHENEQRVQRTAEQLSRAERESEEASAELGRLILSRYHEEQIWSDKIRRASTWGTFALMGVNVLLFVVVQVGFEPWRRKRLVRGFEEKVKEAVQQIPTQQIRQQDTATVIATVPNEDDTTSIAIQLPTQHGNGEEVVIVAEDEAGEVVLTQEEIQEVEEEYIPEKKDIWISAASGAVLGSLLTALTTYLISR